MTIYVLLNEVKGVLPRAHLWSNFQSIINLFHSFKLRLNLLLLQRSQKPFACFKSFSRTSTTLFKIIASFIVSGVFSYFVHDLYLFLVLVVFMVCPYSCGTTLRIQCQHSLADYKNSVLREFPKDLYLCTSTR